MGEYIMKCKKAYLIINPRSGNNLTKLADILAVFAAAGWKTDTALKEFGGQTIQLAKDAADAGYDIVIGYGGDGTLNQVVNGVMATNHRRCIVGVIPGGTANVWAHEVGIPEDPVKAALFLVNSEGRKVDLGYVESDSGAATPETVDREEKHGFASGGRHHFLLMAGLGIDAAIMSHVSTSLKERIGEAAVVLGAAKTLPRHHTFPIEIRSSGNGRAEDVLWRGEALQVIVGNTRRYGNIADVTSKAFIDDGRLDVCIITAGNPLTTIEQIVSILLHRDPVHGRSEYFQGARFWIRVPGSVNLQLDGSRVKRKDCVSESERSAAGQPENWDADMVTYCFDAVPRALRVAIPCTYDDALFEKESGEKKTLTAEEQSRDPSARRVEASSLREAKQLSAEQIDILKTSGRKVTVVAVGPNPEREGTWFVAGVTADTKTGEAKPVAVRIDHDTTIVRATGEPLLPTFVAKLSDGSVIAVDGRKNKHGAIRAKRVVVVSE